MSKPLTQADYVITPENARDRALLIAAQDADAPKLTDRLDAEAMRVLVATLDETRASLAAAEAKLADERKHADELAAHLTTTLTICSDDLGYEWTHCGDDEPSRALLVAHAARRAARDGQEGTRC